MLQFQTHGTILKIEFNYVKAAGATFFSRCPACALPKLLFTQSRLESQSHEISLLAIKLVINQNDMELFKENAWIVCVGAGLIVGE